jgi:hypothetical protein
VLKVLGRAALVAGGLVVGLVLAELILRLVPGVLPRSGAAVPPGIRTPIAPGTIVFQPHYRGRIVGPEFDVPLACNAGGFRERELESFAGRAPVLVLGDSYMFGWGVRAEERVTDVLEHALAARGDSTRLANLAFPGYGTRNYADILEHVGAALRPRAALVGFFVGNDFLDDFNMVPDPEADAAAAEGQDARARIRRHEANRDVRSLLRRSRVVGLAVSTLCRARPFERVFRRMELGNDRIALYGSGDDPLARSLYGGTYAAWDRLDLEARAHGIPLVAVLIPDHLQVLEPGALAGLDMTRPQRLVTEHLAERGIAVVDLLEPLRSAPDARALYFKNDKHWTVAGHAFVASVLADLWDEIPALARPGTGEHNPSPAAGP